MTSVAPSVIPSLPESMRRKGTGTIEVTRDGRYRMRGPLDDRGDRIPLGVVDTLAEAEAILDAACDDLARAKLRVATGVSLKDWGARWLDDRDAQGLTNERGRWDLHVAPDAIASLPVRAIEPGDVRLWIDRVSRSRPSPGNGHRTKRRGDLAPQTVRNILHLLGACLQAAAETGIRPDNPVRGVSIPRRKSDLTRATCEVWTWLDPDEQDCVIECSPSPCGWMVQWAIWTGLREAEQWELRRADIRDDSPRPHVVVRYGSDGGPTKGRRIRYVPLLPGALEAWERWYSAAKDRVDATGVAFPPLRGSRRATRAEGPPPWWEETVRASGVRGQTGHAVTWHSLRHSCGAMLASGTWGRSWSLEEIREFLGHKSITTTQRYAHLAHTALQRAADETAAAMARESAPVVSISSGCNLPADKSGR